MNLDTVSNQELEQELARRRAAEELRLREERQQRLKEIIENKEVLLKFIKHGRTSCSDENPINGLFSGDYAPRCNRCALLELSDHHSDIEIDVDLSIRY